MTEIEIINQSGNKSQSLESLYKAFYAEQNSVEHRFKFNSTIGTQICDHCGITYSQQNQFYDMMSLLYPNFINGVEFYNESLKEVAEMTKVTKKAQFNNILLIPDVNLNNNFVTQRQLSFEYFRSCQARLLDFIGFEDSLISVTFAFGTYDSDERIQVSLSGKSYKKSLNKYLKELEVLRDKLLEKTKNENVDAFSESSNNSSDNLKFFTNDTIHITYELIVRILK